MLKRAAILLVLAALPPVLTFQSVADATVSTPAVERGLYNLLPKNGSELVLFDVNQSVRLAPLIRSSARSESERLLPLPHRNYTVSLMTDRPGGYGISLGRVTQTRE